MKLLFVLLRAIKMFFIVGIIFFVQGCKTGSPDKAKVTDEKLNVLIIVADDLNYDSVGFAGGVAPNVTPNLDRLASESLSFEKAFSTVSVCQPSRQSIFSGLIPIHYGAEGFFPMKAGTPTLPALLREAGYITGNIHKKDHMLPTEAFNWSFDNDKLGYKVPDGVVGRDPKGIAGGLKKFIEHANKKDKPFFMVVNSADSHRPFHGDPINKNTIMWGNGKFDISFPDPSRIYNSDEVVVPPTLPDIPAIRKDLAKYASSVRRLDDTVGACLKVLEELDEDESTLVIFISDNGMPLPYAKFDCYMGSNRSPFLIRWPKAIKNPKIDKDHLVSLMDITPTVLELAKLPIPSPMDGQSLVPFIEDRTPDNWRESIVFLRNQDIYYGDALENVLKREPDFTKRLESIGWVKRPDHPVPGTYSRDKEIRTYYDGQYGYIYNECFKEDGLELGALGAIVPYNGKSLRAMKQASKNNPSIKEQYERYLLREEEELYDWSKDPGSKNNLVNDPKYASILNKARKGLYEYMKSANDPLIEIYKEKLN